MNVFSHESNVDIHKRIVCYDLKELKDNSLQNLGMMIVLENLWNRMAQNRSKGIGTRIYVDEMYLMFQNEQSADFFYKLYKRARKWGGVPTGITQNVADVLRSELAQTMIANTQFVIMLTQNTTDREQLSHLLHIEPETMRFVTNSNPGCGLIFAAKYGTIPFDNTFNGNPTVVYAKWKPSVAYAVFDSTDNSLTFFRDEPDKYNNGQVDGTKTYYANFEDVEEFPYDNSVPWFSKNKLQRYTF